MPRPMNCRKVCHFPQTLDFAPIRMSEKKDLIILTVDEYEAIRLIDKESLSQAQCSIFMQVARTSVQRIYESARKKLADSIVDGHPLRIAGGGFCLCDGTDAACVHKVCPKCRCQGHHTSENQKMN